MSSISFDRFVLVEAQLGKLRLFHSAASAANAVSVVAVPEGTRAGNRTILAGVSVYLARLGPSGDLGIEVTEGRRTVESWQAIANAQALALRDVMESLGEANVLSRFWNEVVIPTGQDVGDIARTGAGGFGLGAGLVIALLLAARFLR